MKNVYFIQANNVYGSARKSTYIPYAVGCIQAYCMQNEIIASHYRFGKIVYSRRPAAQVIAGMENPFMVLFSCSVWNTEYSKTVAAAVKQAYPDCLIVLGGHSISADGADLEACPFADILIHRSGEEPAEGILLALAAGGALSAVPNISYRETDGRVVTTANVPQTGSDYPSPYLTGVFDDILKDDIDFSVLFETNRGCPNACSFCDWSTLKSKVRLFPMARVKAEIDWFVAHKFEFVYCADGNFCLFGRDAEIADYVVACKEKYGYPKVFRVCFTKNKMDLVFSIGSKFVKSGLDKAQTLSFQSMNPEVLANVGRKNIPTSLFRELMKRYNELNISTNSELILGLPGETYDSFCVGVCTLLEYGQHFAVNIYPCELLPNAEMGQKWYREKFNIRSTRVPFKLIHSNAGQGQDEITEYSEYITSTCSMSEQEWARALLFADYIQGLHNLGLLRAVAIYYRYEREISYERFYNRLILYSKNARGTLLHAVYTRIHALCEGVISGANELVATCSGLSDILWGFDELLFLECYKELDRFYAEVMEYALSAYGEAPELADLFAYQRDIVKKIGVSDVVITSEYDFYRYFGKIYLNQHEKPVKKKTELRIRDPHVVYSFPEFAREIVWYGRNRRETDYTSNYYTVELA